MVELGRITEALREILDRLDDIEERISRLERLLKKEYE